MPPLFLDLPPGPTGILDILQLNNGGKGYTGGVVSIADGAGNPVGLFTNPQGSPGGYTTQQYAIQQTLVDAASIAWNLQQAAKVTLGLNQANLEGFNG